GRRPAQPAAHGPARTAAGPRSTPGRCDGSRMHGQLARTPGHAGGVGGAWTLRSLPGRAVQAGTEAIRSGRVVVGPASLAAGSSRPAAGCRPRGVMPGACQQRPFHTNELFRLSYVLEEYFAPMETARAVARAGRARIA